MMNDFYTYAYLREDRTPYYIGKGSGNRVYKKDRRIKPPKDKSRIIFLKKNLLEEEAFRHEIYMIAVFGRKDNGTGILHNRTNGGEGVSGAIKSEEIRKKISEATRKGNASMTPEQRSKRANKQGEGQRKRQASMTPEQRSEIAMKRSETSKGRKWWNDGLGNRKFVLECPGNGWKPGMK